MRFADLIAELGHEHDPDAPERAATSRAARMALEMAGRACWGDLGFVRPYQAT